MFLFDLFKKKKALDSEEIEEESLEEAYDIVSDMYDSLCEKCNYGDSMDALNEYERVIYIVQELESEVNNGGFSQFFYNSSGNFSNEVADAFTKIGAIKTAAICKKALAPFGGRLPVDREERCELLDSLDSDKIESILEKCDDAFFEYEDDLEKLNYEYIIKNKTHFNK